MFIPKNTFNQTPDGKGGGLTQIWEVNGCQGTLTIVQAPSCVSPVDWAASNPQTTFSPSGVPILFGPFVFTVFVPHQYDPNFPPYTSGVWTSPRFSNFPPQPGGAAASVWTITTPEGNSQSFNADSPNFNMSPAQLAEFNAFIKAGGNRNWNLTVDVVNLQAYFPFIWQVSVGFEVTC